MEKLGEESEYVEFKKSTSELKEAMISMVAMLNKHEFGDVYFGVRNNGEIIGQNPLITRTLYYSKHMENFATGFKRVKDMCDKAGCKVAYSGDC